MGTLVIASILTGIISLIITTMVKDKKAGKSLQCGCDCKHCGGHCRHD